MLSHFQNVRHTTQLKRENSPEHFLKEEPITIKGSHETRLNCHLVAGQQEEMFFQITSRKKAIWNSSIAFVTRVVTNVTFRQLINLKTSDIPVMRRDTTERRKYCLTTFLTTNAPITTSQKCTRKIIALKTPKARASKNSLGLAILSTKFAKTLTTASSELIIKGISSTMELGEASQNVQIVFCYNLFHNILDSPRRLYLSVFICSPNWWLKWAMIMKELSSASCIIFEKIFGCCSQRWNYQNWRTSQTSGRKTVALLCQVVN